MECKGEVSRGPSAHMVPAHPHAQASCGGVGPDVLVPTQCQPTANQVSAARHKQDGAGSPPAAVADEQEVDCSGASAVSHAPTDTDSRLRRRLNDAGAELPLSSPAPAPGMPPQQQLLLLPQLLMQLAP
mgnify:CR=1 FL=1